MMSCHTDRALERVRPRRADWRARPLSRGGHLSHGHTRHHLDLPRSAEKVRRHSHLALERRSAREIPRPVRVRIVAEWEDIIGAHLPCGVVRVRCGVLAVSVVRRCRICIDEAPTGVSPTANLFEYSNTSNSVLLW
jgi:hypothetical protein